MSYRHTIGALDDLVELGFVKEWRGFYDRDKGFGLQTRIRARRCLAEFIESFGGQPDMVESSERELIVLRNADGNLLEYDDTEGTNRMRDNLRVINAAFSKARIKLHLSDRELQALSARMADDPDRGPLDTSRVILWRVFNNGSFEQGGRFYGGWWQTLPKEYRPYLDINYKSTIEVDYSGLHVRMLYGMVGTESPEDPYDLPGYERDIQKRALLVLINAEDQEVAVRAMRRYGLKDAETQELIQALRTRHQPISGYFTSGTGVRLQYLDSQLAEQVMLRTIKRGGIALPVHDSFIVRVGREGELQEDMATVWAEMYPDQPPLMSQKESVVSQRFHERRL